MYVVVFALLTFAVILAAFAVFNLGTALAASAFGVPVLEVGIGMGPAIFKRCTRWGVVRIALVPVGSHVQLYGSEEPNAEEDAKLYSNPAWQTLPQKRFSDVGFGALSLISFAGPLGVLLFGMLLLSVPIAIGAPQLSQCSREISMIRPCGVEGLEFKQEASNWAGQFQLFRDTVVEYVVRLFSLRSLAGWGGPLACFITGGEVGATSFPGWISACGVLVLGHGVFTILPLPGGGLDRLLTIIQYTLGAKLLRSASVHVLRLASALVCWIFMLRALGIDAIWLWEAWHASRA